MPELTPAPGGLALYKVRPALVISVKEKIEIELEGGKTKRVRPKDIIMLHPGPLSSLSQLDSLKTDLQETWELLSGMETNIQELAELAFDQFTPSTAWAAWESLAEGLYFEGTPDAIRTRTAEQIQQDREAREARERAELEWNAFLQRMQQKQLQDEDRKRLSEVEMVALERADRSRIMQALGHQESAANAHRLLTGVGYWEASFNPYPLRQGLVMSDPDLPVPGLMDEPRRDLTHLAAYAIDDEGSQDPDDAISLDGDLLWVHVADVAALVTPDSPLDLEARERAANLYVPEKIVHMLPTGMTRVLGLGLQDISPALSFGMRIGDQGEITELQITPSLVRVQRCTYEQVDAQMGDSPFREIRQFTDRFSQRRKAAGAASIDLPEVSTRLRDGEIVIRPLQRLESRQMVTEAMLMVGAAVADYARQHDIPLAYATQPPPAEVMSPETMTEMYAYRRQMKPSRAQTQEEPHFGLGLELYCRATSPLRRYLDLVTHQQLRAHLRNEPLLDREAITTRIAASDIASAAIRRAERLSNTHWKLLYLMRNPDWQGEAVVVEIEEQRVTVMIPGLAHETRIRVKQKLQPDQPLTLALREVDLMDLNAWFRVVK